MYKFVFVAPMAVLGLRDFEPQWIVFALAALSGNGRSFEVPATQGYITKISPHNMPLRAIALRCTAARAVTAFGGLADGFGIHALDAPASVERSGCSTRCRSRFYSNT